MPQVQANGITLNYLHDIPTTSHPSDLLVLINGLADDLHTWSLQIPAFLHAGYTILRYDNRGIGASSRPPGPYTAELMADDLFCLLNALDAQGTLEGRRSFHLLGVSMGGMIAQSYALKYPNGSPSANGWAMLSLTLACTYAHPSPFCSRMFALWADMAVQMSVQDVMRDVTLWAFTVPFFRRREDELREVEAAMRGLEMQVPEYLAQLGVIRAFDSRGRLEGLLGDERVLGGLGTGEVLVLAGQTDILIPVVLSRELAEGVVGARFGVVKGGHGCMWEFPDAFNQAVIDFLDEHREQKMV